MPHAYTTVARGKDICRFLDIPHYLINKNVKITVDLFEDTSNSTDDVLQKLFANAPNIKVPKKVKIDRIMNEINNALP